MSAWSVKMMEENEQRLRAAQEIGIRANVLGICKEHGRVNEWIDDPKGAYKLGNWMWTRHLSLVAIFDSRRDMTDAIQEVCHHCEDCPECIAMDRYLYDDA